MSGIPAATADSPSADTSGSESYINGWACMSHTRQQLSALDAEFDETFAKCTPADTSPQTITSATPQPAAEGNGRTRKAAAQLGGTPHKARRDEFQVARLGYTSDGSSSHVHEDEQATAAPSKGLPNISPSIAAIIERRLDAMASQLEAVNRAIGDIRELVQMTTQG